MTSAKQSARAGQRVIRFFQLGVMVMAISLFSHAAMAEKVNLNQADAETLQYIPGIGPGKSADMIKYREQLGGFKSYEDLLDISGIGEKTLEGIKKYGTLEGGVSELSQEMRDNPPKKTPSTPGNADTSIIENQSSG